MGYSNQGDPGNLFSYTLKAPAIARQRHEKMDLSKFSTNLGDGYEKLNILDSARIYTNQGYDMALETKDAACTGMTLNNK